MHTRCLVFNSGNWFRGVKDGRPVESKGSIDLDKSTAVRVKDPLARSGGLSAFELETSQRTWQLSTKTSFEAHFWVALLKEAKAGLDFDRLYAPEEPPTPSEAAVVDMLKRSQRQSQVELDMLPVPPTADSDDEDGTGPPDTVGLSADDGGGEMYKVLEAYKCEEGEGTLSVAAGEIIKIEEKGSEGWWFAVAGPKNEGWMPAALVTPVVTGASAGAADDDDVDVDHYDRRTTPAYKRDTSAVVSSGAAAGSTAAKPDAVAGQLGEMYKIVEDFKSAEGEGSLDLKAGDIMTIGEKGDGWWFATVDDGTEGWVPETLVGRVRSVACGSPRTLLSRTRFASEMFRVSLRHVLIYLLGVGFRSSQSRRSGASLLL